MPFMPRRNIFFLRNWEKHQKKSLVAWAQYAQLILGKLQCSWSRIFLGPKSGLRPSTSNSKIRHLEIKDFRFKYTPECTVSNMNFQKFSGEGLTEHPPQTPQSRASPSIRASPSFFRRFAPSIRASPSIHPLQHVHFEPTNRGEAAEPRAHQSELKAWSNHFRCFPKLAWKSKNRFLR